jgi:uncharacterized protein (DUF433 family)
METALAPRIVVSRDVAHGKPRVAGTRVAVTQILDLLAAGKTVAEIVSDDYFPHLSEADIFACIRYASLVIQHDDIVTVPPLPKNGRK